MPKILLVEDDPFLQTLYKDLLSGAQYEVTSVLDGNEALTKIKQGGWDLILLDVILAKLSGIEVVKKLKAESPDALKQKIVFLTNIDTDEVLNEITSLGFTYLLKSKMNPGEFLTKINTYLQAK